MTPHIHLALVFHQHQPVGNFGFVFEELYAKSYDPLVSCLERHAGVKAALHYSGPLLDWLLREKPEYIGRVRALVERGQVEMLGGGYYEPILPAISDADRHGQMTKLRDAVAEHFGKSPTGAWLPERVWEPDLPASIAGAGYRWTLVDDVHFEGAGFRQESLHGWYNVEHQGASVGVFPSSTALRYLVPWGTVDACIDFLRDAGDRAPGSLVTIGDDGEKFGGWPTTYEHCWENGWVDAFFARLEQESHWIETTHPGSWRASKPAESLVYLPATSYMEMGEWSLPADEQAELATARTILRESGRGDLTRFLRGGHWRNFLVRYPEVNLLQKRTQVLAEAALRLKNDEALDYVWKAECNCPYWHGVFGGVYLEHIRHANFGNLAAADALLFPGPQPADVRDWNGDGRDEVCLRSAQHLIVISPHAGGEVLHWDLRQQPWHLTHAVARRPEAYHRGLEAAANNDVHSIHDGIRVKDPSAIASALLYDRGMRLAAQDTLTGERISQESYRELRLEHAPKGGLCRVDGTSVALECEANGLAYAKRLEVAESVTVDYDLGGGVSLASEWNLSLPEAKPGEPPVFAWSPGRLRIESGSFVLCAEFDADDAWHEQLFSVSNTEGGVELAPQGWSMVFVRQLREDRSTMTIRWTPGE